MTRETLKTWDRIERAHQGSWTVRVITGRAVIQCPFCPDGRYMEAGKAGWYLAPGYDVLIIAVEPTELEWRNAYMYGFTGEVSRELSGGGAS